MSILQTGRKMSQFFCPISYSKTFKKLHSIKKFPIFMGVSKINKKYKFQNLNWWINKNSGNVQIHPKISLDKLYFKSHGSGTIGKVWRDHHNAFFLFSKLFIKGNICEIGGGNNSILNKIKNFSKIITFYCFDKNLKLKKNNKKIIKVHEFFSNNFFKKKKTPLFDLVLHSHTFEHLYDPNKFLTTVKSILKKNGTHIFTMPNMMPMIKRGYANAMNFEHPYFYDEKLIDNLLYKNNFKIIKKKFFKEDHSIMYITKISQSSKTSSYRRYKKNLTIFNHMFNFWKDDINKINKSIKNSSNVFIFGAHIFSQLMLFNGLNKKKIDGILDNDPHKINNFLYGTKLKIYSPIVLQGKINPHVILRAGSYNSEIKKQILQINPKAVIV